MFRRSGTKEYRKGNEDAEAEQISESLQIKNYVDAPAAFLQVLGTLYLPTLTAQIVNNGIVKGDVNYVWRTGGIMLAAALLTAGVSVLETYLSISSFSAMGRDLRNDLFRKSQRLTINEFNSFGPASMITRCTHDVEQIQEAYTEAIEMLLPAPVMAIAGLVLAFRKNPALALLIVVSTLIACVLMIVFNAKAIRLFHKLQLMLDGINRKLREILPLTAAAWSW